MELRGSEFMDESRLEFVIVRDMKEEELCSKYVKV